MNQKDEESKLSLASAESAFENPLVALLIGAAVSLDVIALTFCSAHIYQSGFQVWRRWAKYNAGWHAGLLIFYLLVIDVGSVAAQYIGVLISFPLPDWLTFLKPIWIWIGEKFRSHIVVYAAIVAMAYVWYQYSKKVRATPTDPDVADAPFFLRPLFRRGEGKLSDQDSRWFWHLSCCLVAIDMLALAAVVKSGEKLIQFPRGIDGMSISAGQLTGQIMDSFDGTFFVATITVSVAVFVVVYLLCLAASRASRHFWTNLSDSTASDNHKLTGIFIVVALKLLEPFVIFYFIIHSMAFLATGVPLHSPAFLLGSAFLVAALIQYVTFSRILVASKTQIDRANHNLTTKKEGGDHV